MFDTPLNEDIVLAVQRGVEALNYHYPEWKSMINANTLNMIDQRYCVLGQIGSHAGYGYSDMAAFLEERTFLSDEDLGFSVATDRDEPWEYLQELWELELAK